MKYSYNYEKLEHDIYTTIRRYKKANIGDRIREYYPLGSHIAIVLAESRFSLNDLPLDVLLNDTDCETFNQVVKLFQSFYKKPIDIYKDKFYVYVLGRVKD